MISQWIDFSNRARRRRKFIASRLLHWSNHNSSSYPWRNRTTPYKVLISELLLRRTRANKVAELFQPFLKEFPTVSDLADCSPEKLSKLIHSLGRPKRVHEIIAIAQKVENEHSGVIPSSEKELLDIIGKQSNYTVNAIRCFAFGERVPIFDVNVNRIISRILSIDFGKQPHKSVEAWKLAEMLLPESHVREYNWALLDLGRMICTPRPKCEICPLSAVCDYGKSKRPILRG